MNFKDPFNRLSCKEENEYQALRQQLLEIGIDSEEKALNLMGQSRKRMLAYCLGALIICVTIALIAPQSTGIVVVFGGLLLLWLVTTMARGQRMLKQFVLREFSSEKP